MNLYNQIESSKLITNGFSATFIMGISKFDKRLFDPVYVFQHRIKVPGASKMALLFKSGNAAKLNLV